MVASGGGAIVVNSGGANFQVGGATGATNDNRATVDFSGLTSFTANLGAGTFRLGDGNSGTENNASTLRLATNNTITAASVRIGDGSGGGYTHTLTLGSGTNVINADTLNVGSAGAAIRSGGEMIFDPGDTTGTLAVRASDGSGRATINVINTTGNTAGDMIGTLDLSGHTADILASTLTMAYRTQNTGAATATFTFDQGTLDVTTLAMASRTDAGTGDATATATIGGGTATVGSVTMAVNTSAGGAVGADLNVTGGSVTFGTGTGTAIHMANAGTGRTVTSTLDLLGGTVDVDGDILRAGGAGTENATATLDGAILDMNNHTVGDATNPIAFVAASGALRNLAELNGGATLTKTTGGTLAFDAANAYTGATVISAGTLSAAATGAMGSTASVTVQSGGTLLLAGTSPISNRINDLAGFTLDGGTIDTGAMDKSAGDSETVGILTLSANSIINMGANETLLTFADSSGAGWTLGTILSIYNWTGTPGVGGGTDQIFFGNSGGGLSISQAAQVKFYSGTDPGTTYIADGLMLGSGELVPVPEPSTGIAALLLVGLVLLAERRRRQARPAAAR